jgi:hypothetical protein
VKRTETNMTRVVVRLGDIFAANLDDSTKKYFQYIGDDQTQLNSRVIKVFKKAYATADTPDLREVVNGDVDFYAHVVIRWGLQMNLWEKVGNVKDVGRTDVLFRGTSDAGRHINEPPVEISEKWYVWRINEPTQRVGKLEGENRKAEIGLVMSPANIVHRMRTGRYNFVYPGY